MSNQPGQDPHVGAGQDPKKGAGQDPMGGGQGPTAGELQAEIDRLKAENKELRAEAAARRVEAKDLREELERAKSATTGDLSKLEEKVQALEASAHAANQRLIDAELRVAAHKAGFRNPEAAIKLLDREKLRLDGASVLNAEDVLGELAKAEPYMIATPGGGDAGAGSGAPAASTFNDILRAELLRP